MDQAARIRVAVAYLNPYLSILQMARMLKESNHATPLRRPMMMTTTHELPPPRPGDMAAVFKMRDEARMLLHRYDLRMRRQRFFTVYVQTLQAILTLMIPLVAYTLRDNSSMALVFSSGVAVLAAALGMFQFAFNPQSRWAHYVILRSQLQNLLFDVDIALHKGHQLSSEDLDRVYDNMRRI